MHIPGRRSWKEQNDTEEAGDWAGCAPPLSDLSMVLKELGEPGVRPPLCSPPLAPGSCRPVSANPGPGIVV